MVFGMKKGVRFSGLSSYVSTGDWRHLVGLKDVECLVYLDILIFSATIPEDAHRMGFIFHNIREANFKLLIGKCIFTARRVSYLGHILSKDGVSSDQGKITLAIFPDLRRLEKWALLGLSGYYRFFIKDYASFSRPLIQMTKTQNWNGPMLSSFHLII
jgi:hypothetical protein